MTYNLHFACDRTNSIVPWITAVDWSMTGLALLTSTFWTTQVPNDIIVTRVGWAMQNWNDVLNDKSDDIPIIVSVASVYMVLDELMAVWARSD